MFIILAAAVAAQPLPPAPTVEIPDLAVPEAQLGDERKFFLFHRAGVGLEEARADLSFCYQHLPNGQQIALPAFVPWVTGPALAKEEYQPVNYGLVGAVMAGLLADKDYDAPSRLNMVRCMAPRGYSRFRTSRELWREINSKGLETSITIQARIASGEAPPTARILR